MRGSIVVLALLLAGCASVDVDPVLETDPGPPLLGYRDCSWANGTQAACDIPDFERYHDAVVRDFEDTSGWKCIVPRHVGGPSETQTNWWFLRGPAVTDGPPELRSFRVGFLFDVLDRPGPYSGVLWNADDDSGTRYVFTADQPRFFVEVPENLQDPDVLWQGMLLGGLEEGPLERMPDPDQARGRDPKLPGVLNVTGLDVEYIEHAWSRTDAYGFFPQPYHSLTLHTDEGPRHIPTYTYGEVGGPDPRSQAGSGHWGGYGDGLLMANLTQSGATVKMMLPIISRFDVHFDDVFSPFAGWVCDCSWIGDDVWRELCLATGGLVNGPPARLEARNDGVWQGHTLAS